MKSRVLAGQQPWISTWNNMIAWPGFRDGQLGRTPSSLSFSAAPFSTINVGASENPRTGHDEALTDATAAYIHALQWVVTGNPAHAEKTIEICNAWGINLTSITGVNRELAAAWIVSMFCDAAEIVKSTYSSADPQAWNAFDNMLRNTMYPILKDFKPTFNGNWDALITQAMISIGVVLDDQFIFDRAKTYFLSGSGNGSLVNYIYTDGRTQETNRDQYHEQMGVLALTNTAEIAWKQGIDLYSALNNRLLLGLEGTAKRVDDQNINCYSGWDIAYNHFNVRLGLPTPQMTALKQTSQWRGHTWSHNTVGLWTQLTFRDLGGNSTTTNITLSNATVSDNSPIGTLVGILNATESGPTSPTNYSFSIVSGDVSAFEISGIELRTKHAFDVSTKDQYSLGIRATNEVGDFFDKEITIRIISVVELDGQGNLKLGVVPSPVSGQDGTNGGPSSISISGDRSSATLTGNTWKYFPLSYTVTANTVLEVTVNAANVGEIIGVILDNDTAATTGRRAFIFGGSQYGESSLNDWAWMLTPRLVSGQTLTYTIPVGNYFTGPVNYLGLIADDDASPFTTNVTYANLRLHEGGTPTPANNPPTSIALSNSSVAENSASGTLVGNLTTTDPDAGNTHTYSFVGGDLSAFSIVGNQLRTAAVFDFDTKSSYSVTIRSTDQGGLSFDKAFIITVTDGNDSGGTVSINPAADSFTQQGSSSTNYGSDPSLLVKSTTSTFTRRIYLKFPVADFTSATHVSLVLRLVSIGTEGPTGHSFNLHEVSNDSWTENGLTWNNQPGAGTVILSRTVTNAEVGTDILLDVTNYVKAQAAGDGMVTFALVQTANTNRQITFSSKEGQVSPRLIATMPGSPATYDEAAATMDWGTIPLNQRGPLDNPRGDRYNNFLKWALDGSMTEPEQDDLAPLVIEEIAPGQIRLRLSYLKAVDGLLYQLKWSTDLVNWFDTDVSPEQFDSETGLHYQSWTAPVSTSKAFGRLEISE